MKIHEYQAKQILARYNVRIPRGEIASNKEEARAIAQRLGGTVVVKAQIHAGGRGKGGGVKLAKSPDEAADLDPQGRLPNCGISLRRVAAVGRNSARQFFWVSLR